jgi:hypothetical protein
MASYNPKHYFDDGRTTEYGADLGPERMEALRRGEIFTLLDREGRPWQRILMDSYDQLRAGSLDEPSDLAPVLGIPPSPHAERV